MQYHNDLQRRYLVEIPIKTPKASLSTPKILLITLGVMIAILTFFYLLLIRPLFNKNNNTDKNATANPDDDTSKDKPKEDTKPQEPSVESPDGGSPRRSGSDEEGDTNPDTNDDGGSPRR